MSMPQMIAKVVDIVGTVVVVAVMVRFVANKICC